MQIFVFFIFLFILDIPRIASQEYYYEEHATIKEILQYLSILKTEKDIEMVYLPLKDQSYWLQDFIKLQDEQFYTIYFNILLILTRKVNLQYQNELAETSFLTL